MNTMKYEIIFKFEFKLYKSNNKIEVELHNKDPIFLEKKLIETIFRNKEKNFNNKLEKLHLNLDDVMVKNYSAGSLYFNQKQTYNDKKKIIGSIFESIWDNYYKRKAHSKILDGYISDKIVSLSITSPHINEFNRETTIAIDLTEDMNFALQYLDPIEVERAKMLFYKSIDIEEWKHAVKKYKGKDYRGEE